MIRKGWEIAIFIAIFVICGLLILSPIMRWKASLPINAGLTAEQVIEQEYPHVAQQEYNYDYTTKDNYMFLFVDKADAKEDSIGYNFYIGFKNSQSGYILKLPGLNFGDIYDLKVDANRLDNEEVLSLQVRRYFGSEYVIMLEQRNANGIEFFVNGEEMDSITYEGDTKWIDVAKDLTDDFEIYAMYEGEKIDVVNGSQIISGFEESGYGLFN